MMISKLPHDPRDAVSREEDDGLLHEVGGPVPDFLRPALFLKDATDRIKQQLSASDGKDLRERPVLKEEEGARLRRLLSEMTTSPGSPEPTATVEDPYHPSPWAPPRPALLRRAPEAIGRSAETAIAWLTRRSLRAGPLLATCLIVGGGVTGAGITYLAFARAAAPSVECVGEACAEAPAPAEQVVVQTVQKAASPGLTIPVPAPAATSTPAPAAVEEETAPVARPVVEAALGAIAPVMPRGRLGVTALTATSALRPSRAAPALSLPAPEPLAIPPMAMVEPPRETPAAPQPKQLSEEREVAIVDGDDLNVRAEPSKAARKLFTLSSGEEVTVLETEDDWTHIRTAKDREGWVFSDVTDTLPRKLVPGTEAAKQEATASAGDRVVRSGGVTVRSGPARKNSALFNLNGGTPVTVLGEKDGWAHIKDKKGRQGWAYADYLVRS